MLQKFSPRLGPWQPRPPCLPAQPASPAPPSTTEPSALGVGTGTKKSQHQPARNGLEIPQQFFLTGPKRQCPKIGEQCAIFDASETVESGHRARGRQDWGQCRYG